jgi:hypothetical protein
MHSLSAIVKSATAQCGALCGNNRSQASTTTVCIDTLACAACVSTSFDFSSSSASRAGACVSSCLAASTSILELLRTTSCCASKLAQEKRLRKISPLACCSTTAVDHVRAESLQCPYIRTCIYESMLYLCLCSITRTTLVLAKKLSADVFANLA